MRAGASTGRLVARDGPRPRRRLAHRAADRERAAAVGDGRDLRRFTGSPPCRMLPTSRCTGAARVAGQARDGGRGRADRHWSPAWSASAAPLSRCPSSPACNVQLHRRSRPRPASGCRSPWRRRSATSSRAWHATACRRGRWATSTCPPLVAIVATSTLLAPLGARVAHAWPVARLRVAFVGMLVRARGVHVLEGDAPVGEKKRPPVFRRALQALPMRCLTRRPPARA